MKKWAIITLVSAIVIVAALVTGFLYLHFSFQLKAYVYVHEERGYITIHNMNEFDWEETVVEINRGDQFSVTLNQGTIHSQKGITVYYGVGLEKAGLKKEEYRVHSVRIIATTPIFRKVYEVNHIVKPPDY